MFGSPVCSYHVLGMFSRYIYLYTSVVEVWCVGGILCTTFVACTRFSYIASIACLGQGTLFSPSQPEQWQYRSVQKGILHNKLRLRPLPQINKLRMSKKIGRTFFPRSLQLTWNFYLLNIYWWTQIGRLTKRKLNEMYKFVKSGARRIRIVLLCLEDKLLTIQCPVGLLIRHVHRWFRNLKRISAWTN